MDAINLTLQLRSDKVQDRYLRAGWRARPFELCVCVRPWSTMMMRQQPRSFAKRIEQILILLLQFVVRFLDAASQKQQQSKQSPAEPVTIDDDPLAEAYRFMELQAPTTEEQLKKQYRRLSLRYHPDRNHQSAESIANQQRLNACMDVIRQSLAGEEESEEEEEEFDEEEYRRQQEEQQRREEELFREFLKEQQQQEHKLRQKSGYKNKKQQKARAKARARDRQRQEQKRRKEEKRRMQEEMRQEQKRWDIMRQQVREEQTRIRKMVKGMVEHEEKEFAVLEECLDERAVAIRLGQVELFMEMLDTTVTNQVMYSIRDDPFASRLEILQKDVEIRSRLLLEPLDEEQNTFLHYAVYWEQPEIIHYLIWLGQELDILGDLLEASNAKGQRASYFASRAKDPSIKAFMDAQENEWQRRREATQLGPAFQRARQQLEDIAKRASLGTILHTVIGFYTGKCGFGLHGLLCAAGMGFLHYHSLFITPGAQDELYGGETVLTLWYLVCAGPLWGTYRLAVTSFAWWNLGILLLAVCLVIEMNFLLTVTLTVLQFVSQTIFAFHRHVMVRKLRGVGLSRVQRKSVVLLTVALISFLVRKALPALISS